MRLAAIPTVILLFAFSGCDQYEQEAVSRQPPPPNSGPAEADNAPTTGPPSPHAGARPSYAGARQAAHNTIDKLNERQRELEEAMEDQD